MHAIRPETYSTKNKTKKMIECKERVDRLREGKVWD